jgi:hypothetical protein
VLRDKNRHPDSQRILTTGTIFYSNTLHGETITLTARLGLKTCSDAPAPLTAEARRSYFVTPLKKKLRRTKMPFIPAIVEAAVAVGEAVADAAAGAAATAGATAAEVGGEAAATGAEVGAEAGEVGAEAGEVGGEIGGEGSSVARNAADIGKQVFKGAKKADDIIQHLNSNNNNNSNSNSPGNVGVHPLASAIDSMSGGSSVGAGDGLFQNHESVGEGLTQGSSPESPRAPIADDRNIGVGPEEDSSYLTDVGPVRGSGNMRI